MAHRLISRMTLAIWSASILAFVGVAFGDPILLHDDWVFRRDIEDHGLGLGWHLPAAGDQNWEPIDVPADWGPFDGTGWYRRTLVVPEEMLPPEGNPVIVFEGVDDEAWVYVDGQLAAESHSWNQPFVVPLARFIEPGSEDPVTLAVRVVDHGVGGGIWQPVSLRDATSEADLYKSALHDEDPLATLEDVGNVQMYSLFVRTFTPEGTFDAARERLPELRGLGVNVVWLLPIHPIGIEKRKGERGAESEGSPYAIRDYYAVNPDYGTEEDFREFVDAAHELEMRVIIDAVLNHTSPDSVLVEEHIDWFERDAQGNPVPDNPDWWDIVDLDWTKPEVAEYMSEMLQYWVREFDIDGYRCDVASLMPTPFWERVRAELEAIEPNLIMLAESADPELHLGAFDLTYNWTLWDTMVGVFSGRLPAEALRAPVQSAAYRFPAGSALLNFTENHDKERAVNVFGGPRQAKLAAVLACTLPGVPLLYTGTETGAAEPRDIFDKYTVSWDEDEHGMRAFWTSLLALRASSAALKYGDVTLLDARPAEQAFAFERKHGGQRALVVLNLSGEPCETWLEHDLLPEPRLELGPWTWAIFMN